MTKKEICFLTISQLADIIQRRELSPVDVTQALLDRIEDLNPKLNAYILVLKDAALQMAAEAERSIVQGNYFGPLHGVPISLKDIVVTNGVRTTCGSKVLRNYIPDYDATIVERLRASGAIIVGKTNLHEFALGTTTVNPHYGATRNPWDTERISGGSSGGSAAALAASLCFGSIGTDTGGSIRIPSAFCGTVGLKPTFGRVSRFGVIPLSWSLDHVGPMAKTVKDTALMLQVISGWDVRDPTSRRVPVPNYSDVLDGDVRGLKVGIAEELFLDNVSEPVKQASDEALKAIQNLGVHFEEIRLPNLKYVPAIYNNILLPEAASYHERYMKTNASDYSDRVRSRLQLGKLIPATDYLKAQRARRRLQEDFKKAFEKVDLMLGPTVPIAANKIGEVDIDIHSVKKSLRSVHLHLTRPFNLTGLPALSMPCGFTADGLPIGLQIVGNSFDESTLLRLAYAYEQATPWHTRRPID